MQEESWDEYRETASFIAGLALGALIGAGVALLYAPQSGRRTRRKIARTAEDWADAAEENLEDAREDVRRLADKASRDARRLAERARRKADRTGDRVSDAVDKGRSRLKR